MENGFTTPCMVRVKDAKIAKNLNEWLQRIGYVASEHQVYPPCSHFATFPFVGVSIIFDKIKIRKDDEQIDCGYNIELFKALAAMNNMTATGQWFIHGNVWYNYDTCDAHIREKINDGWAHKATVADILVHFKNIDSAGQIRK